MKTLHPTTRNPISHQLPVDTAMRHPELVPGTEAQTDAELSAEGVLTLPSGTPCTILSRSPYFADVEVNFLDKPEVFHVPLYALKAGSK